MRPMMNGEEAGGGTVTEKQSLADVEVLWNAWEIHFLILTSLFLQVFLFVFAWTRRCCASRFLRLVVWLAYVSADSVAIFVLGHLAVRASDPSHHLMSFWAPFVLVHLGGQDTITAFSKEDNDLWKRHLLSFVTQVGVAGYVVANASWPDRRLKAAMVIMFFSGFYKCCERSLCLLLAGKLGPSTLYEVVMRPSRSKPGEPRVVPGKEEAKRHMSETIDMMLQGSISKQKRFGVSLMSEDFPLNNMHMILATEELPGMLNKVFQSRDRCARAYWFVAARLVHCYEELYTKNHLFYRSLYDLGDRSWGSTCGIFLCLFLPPYIILHFVSTPIALVLFWATDKGGQLHGTSRADITVSYILLIGAIVLDLSSATMFTLSQLGLGLNLPILGPKQWSEKLAQYSVILDEYFLKVEPISLSNTDHKSPIKKFILDNLLCAGTKEEWNIASSPGELALQKWVQRQEDPDSTTTEKALEKSISVDFATSVLIWHIATDICYYSGDNANSSADQMEKHKEVSRQLSNYIMYLVFNCGVMCTTNSMFVFENAHQEIRKLLEAQRRLTRRHKLGEKDAVCNLFETMKKEQESMVIEIQKLEGVDDEQQESTVVELHGDAPGSHVQKLKQCTIYDFYHPVLPRACKVAQLLLSIQDENKRWDLISSVWSNRLYYMAPRCGGDFHYKHLIEGGEFITHVFFLMYFLGPFLPPPGA